MLNRNRNRVIKPGLCLGLGLLISAGIVGCGGGGGSESNTSAQSDQTQSTIAPPTEQNEPASRAVADSQAPAGFSFTNYQVYTVDLNDFDKTGLEAGQQYILKVADSDGGVYYLASVNHQQLAQITVSVPLATPTLQVQLFKVADGELTLNEIIAL